MQGADRLCHRIARTGRRRWLVLCGLGLGAVAALGQAPLGLWPLTLLAFAAATGLFLHTPTLRRAALLGWALGTGHFALALSWIVEPFFVDAATHGWMAPFAITFMAAGLALFWAAGMALAFAAGGRSLALIAALTLAEAARGVLFTGFPWAQPGHIWIDTGLVHTAAVAGALGLVALTLTLAAALWQLVAGARLTGALILALGALLFVAGPALNTAPPTPPDAPTVRLVQPNAAQHEKWDPAMIPVFFQRQMDYTRATPRPDLTVWPETAIPVLLNNAQPTLTEIARAAEDTPVVLGVQRLDGLRLYNSLIQLGAGGTITALYDKHHLVPFGEYFPLGRFFQRFGLRGLAAEDGNGYSSGPGAELIDIPGLGTALPLICYEGVFPYDVAAAPARPDFLLLITNDAWFGEVSGPYQHLAQARLRSVEQGLPMIRVANTGISAMIDARGQITAALPLGQAGYLDTALPPANPPTLYARTGDALILAALLLALLGSRATSRRSRPVSD